MPKALITGITGQSGSYLAELLLDKGYEVHGFIRPTSQPARSHIAPLQTRIHLHLCDLGHLPTLKTVLAGIAPDEIYHLAAQTHVAVAFQDPLGTAETNALGTLRLLEIARTLPKRPRLFHASSSQIFGQPDHEPQTELTPLNPLNPYGASKAFATQLVRIARDAYGLFAVNGILYNHESPRRGVDFVTAKICRAAASIQLGRQSELKLGDTTALRDWGDARDFVDGFWRSLQHGEPGDYIFATGKLHSVQDVIEIAFETAGLDWKKHVQTDPSLFRIAEAHRLVGDPSRARQRLGWENRTPFRQLIAEMTTTAMKELSAHG